MATKFKWTWLKGHQVKKKGTKPTIDVLINHHMDVEAGEATKDSIAQPSDAFIPQSTVAIIYKDEICHSSPRQIVEESSQSANLKVHIQKKMVWDNKIVDLVDWKNFGKCLQTTKYTTRTDIIKWSIIGSMMGSKHISPRIQRPTKCRAFCY